LAKQSGYGLVKAGIVLTGALRRRIGLAAAVPLLLIVAACGPVLQNGTPLATVLDQQNNPAASVYHLQPGDQIEVHHMLDADYNAVVVVAPDGRISVPGIDQPIRAQGLTIAELGQEMDRLFQKSRSLTHPFFSLNLRSFGSLQVFVGGEVQRPGYLELTGARRNVMQVLMAAGGFLPTARTSEILVLRPLPEGKQEIFAVDMDKVLHGTDLAQNVQIDPLDTVFVPRSDIANWDLFVDQYIRLAFPIPVSGNLVYQNNPSTSIFGGTH
jgi:protein involved in polysaccharide export with SLBB domain